MRISDWSSDVCSSDLKVATTAKAFHRWGKSFDCQRGQWANPGNGLQAPRCVSLSRENLDLRGSGVDAKSLLGDLLQKVAAFHKIGRASCMEECVSTGRPRGSPYTKKKKQNTHT